MMTFAHTWLLITYLAGGEVASVQRVDNALACIAQSHFEMRFDPRITTTYCMLVLPDHEA